MFLEYLFPYVRHEVKTTAKESEVLRRVRFAFLDEDRYTVQTDEDSFLVKEKMTRYSGSIRMGNSFAPIAKGTFRVDAGHTVVSVMIRPRLISLLILLVFLTVYAAAFVMGVIGLGVHAVSPQDGSDGSIAALLVLYPLILLVQYFAFKRPAKRMCVMIDQAIAEAEKQE